MSRSHYYYYYYYYYVKGVLEERDGPHIPVDEAEEGCFGEILSSREERIPIRR